MRYALAGRRIRWAWRAAEVAYVPHTAFLPFLRDFVQLCGIGALYMVD